MTDGRPQMYMTSVRTGARGVGRRASNRGVGNGAPQPRATEPSPLQAMVLACVYDEPQRAGEIAARAGMTSAQVSNALGHLKGKGLVVSTKHGWVRA